MSRHSHSTGDDFTINSDDSDTFSNLSDDSDTKRSSFVSPSRKKTPTRVGSSVICDEAQVVLLNSIISPQGERSYASILDRKPNLFGEPNSSLRVKIHSRRGYLKSLRETKPSRFFELCSKFGVEGAEVNLPFAKRPEKKKEAVSTEKKRIAVSKMTSPVTVTRTRVGFTMKETYSLKFDNKTEENPYSVFAVVAQGVVINDQLFDVATIYMPGFCIRDFHDKKISATLLNHKDGFEIAMPSVSSFVLDPAKLARLYSAAGNPCERTKHAHVAAAIAIKGSEERRSKVVVFRFPDGVTAKTDFYNYEDEFKLKTCIWMEKDNITVSAQHSLVALDHCVYWKVVLDGEKKILKEKAENLEEAFMKEFQRMLF